jgi:ABC-type polysaccharide/polyol phosphate transport system ATPase subunit
LIFSISLHSKESSNSWNVYHIINRKTELFLKGTNKYRKCRKQKRLKKEILRDVNFKARDGDTYP